MTNRKKESRVRFMGCNDPTILGKIVGCCARVTG